MDLPKIKEELYGTYYLKNELIDLCKKYGLPTLGSKENLLEYICNFIENKPIKKIKMKSKILKNGLEPSLEKIIDINYSNNEIHRVFFIKAIGANFKFNVQFMNWMEKNKGKKTYKDAIEMYHKILLEKNGKKPAIGKQFEYNQYTRDFFKNNPKSSREDCIKCWNFKKRQIGEHKYEKGDLIALENNLTKNIEKIHTTDFGSIRIKRNLELKTEDVANWCKQQIEYADEIYKKGKNWYVLVKNCVITINSHSYTIITAHKK